eukprot:UN4588
MQSCCLVFQTRVTTGFLAPSFAGQRLTPWICLPGCAPLQLASARGCSLQCSLQSMAFLAASLFRFACFLHSPGLPLVDGHARIGIHAVACRPIVPGVI